MICGVLYGHLACPYAVPRPSYGSNIATFKRPENWGDGAKAFRLVFGIEIYEGQMDEKRRTEIEELRRLLDFGQDHFQDESEARLACPLCNDVDCHITLQADRGRYACTECGQHGTFRDLTHRLKAGVRPGVQDADFEEVPSVPATFVAPPMKVIGQATLAKPRVNQLSHADRVENALPHARFLPPKPKRFTLERIIITALALLFLAAGLSAAALSGFANYQAFSSSVADEMQGRIWGWTGVIAAIVSFGGFTFFYWHSANHRMKEGVRALLFALAGAGTSIVGTQAYISANTARAEAAIEQAGSNTDLLTRQIEDWRTQLAGIPTETRSVDGLEAYIAEVERVGRTDHKPYRDARNELGLAKRRDELQAKIDAANAELLGTGEGNILTRAQNRAAIPGWFFAAMLEVFSSQGTSIGLVALLILFSRRRDAEEQA